MNLKLLKHRGMKIWEILNILIHRTLNIVAQQWKQSGSTRKRRVSLTENVREATPSKNPTETLNNLKVEPILCTSPIKMIKVKANQRDELIAMREKMLAIQRRKMEDRERRKRENSGM